MPLLGLTGSIASGKSTVSSHFRSLGAVVIDADVLAREAVAPGTPALRAIIARWGTEILAPDGTLDRGRLRQIVFQDSEALHALNDIVHPEVERRRIAAIAAARQRGARLIVCDIPLLFEKGLEGLFDMVVFVDASDKTRRERLIRSRGLTADEAVAMMSAQMANAEKRSRADTVITNDGTLSELEAQVRALHERLTMPAVVVEPSP